MPSFSQVNGVWVLDVTPTGVAGAKLQANAVTLGSHLVATADAHTIGAVTGLTAALAAKAPLSSPDLTGVPTVPTAAGGTNTTQAASTAFVATAVAARLAVAANLSDVANAATARTNLGLGTAATSASSAFAAADHDHDDRYYSRDDADDLLGAKANATHAHAAGDITSGTFDVARIGSGTPAAGKYVDGGTGAWTTLPGGGGGSTPTLADVLAEGADAAGYSVTGVEDLTADGTVTAGGFTGNGGNLSNLVVANFQGYPDDPNVVLRGNGTWGVPTVSPACPTGTVLPYAGTDVPAGWLACDGAEVSRSTYADLFAVVGTAFGIGDGTTTFQLPDMRSRYAVGGGFEGGNPVGTVVGGGEYGPSYTDVDNNNDGERITVLQNITGHDPYLSLAFIVKT